ncbi:MAG: VOC family protein [Planctomycetaceae bacterium]
MPVSEHAVYYLEIVTPDTRATSDFYSKAYGWRFEPEAPELGNALVATLPDGCLCGIRAPMHEQEKPIVRTYLRVADIDAAVKQAAELGATVALERMEIPGRGKVAIYFLGGIEQGLWQV